MNEFKPVAWLLMDGTIISEYSYNLRKLKEDGDIPLFTQRTWVGLDEDERTAIRESVSVYHDISGWSYAKAVQQATELKLKEKNT